LRNARFSAALRITGSPRSIATSRSDGQRDHRRAGGG
jgi:hypothetical protein